MKTIRERLTRQWRITYALTLPAIAVGTGLAYVGHDQIAIYLIMAFAVAAVVYANLVMKCPKCRHSLVMAGSAMPQLKQKSVRQNFCPGCGVSFDESV